MVGYILDESPSSFPVYLLWKRFFRYNLGLFKMKKYMYNLPQDSNSSESFFFSLKVKTEYMSTWFPTIFPVGNSFILSAGRA